VVLVLLTGGLWLVSWVALCIGKVMRPWRCEHCGWHKPEFGRQSLPAKPAEPLPVRVRRHTPPPLITSQPSHSQP